MEIYKKNKRCSKCNWEYIRDTYKKDHPVDDFNKEEVIKRRCTNCGYIWYEKPLDSKGKKGKQILND